MLAEEYFDTEWPAEVPRLRRLLARNGITFDAIDDVLQESALRLYRAWGRVFDDQPLRPLVNTIVLNAARDHHRRAHVEVMSSGSLPDTLVVDHRGAEQIVMAKLELERAGRAMRGLSEQQRGVVVGAIAEELAGEQMGRSRAPAATRMAITRARRRLVEVLEITAAALGLAGAAVWGQATRRGVRPAVALGLVALGALALSHRGGGERPNVPSAPAQATLATGSPPYTGVSEWHYDTSAPAVHLVDWSWHYDGTSRWNWQAVPLISLKAYGADVSAGSSYAGSQCTVRLADRVELRYRCLPAGPDQPSATHR